MEPEILFLKQEDVIAAGVLDMPKVMEQVEKEIGSQLERLPRKELASKALENSKLVVVKDIELAIELANSYAPEHLIIQAENYMELSARIVNAGSVFLGPYACESAGDYASGTNHTLPTHGYATAYSGVNLDSFCRKITFQHLTREGIRQIGWAVATMADAESLTAHQRAMTIRMETIEKEQN